MLFVALLLLLAAGQLQATIQRDLLTYINDLRSLHSAGPLINSPTATAFAQKAADKLARDQDVNAVYNPQFSTNHCEFTGKLSQLAQTCSVAWYTTVRDHSWCTPQVNGKSRPFINMVWNATSRAGTGITKGRNGKYYVVTYFSPKKNSDVKGNVHPVRIVTKASDKAKCAPGFTRFGSSCFKFHPEKVTWDEAVTKCALENATLTSVRNQKEEQFLRTLQERGNGKGWMWIGLHDRNNEHHFTWLDGLEFANGVCAPVSAYGGHSENCVAWTTQKPMSCWSDKKCADRNPFMCRMPVDGKSTFRTEILFKKFRWNPNFRNKNSKAFRDLRRGLRVTFNEVFQRSSGRIGGGFRSLKIKSVRPLSIQGRRRGTAITLSIQFRAKVADPTLKFQKFLRPSERLISITVDSPVVHQSALGRTVCSFPCKRAANHYCHTWSHQHQHQHQHQHHAYHTNTYTNTYQHAGYTNTGYPGYTTYHHTGYDQQCPSYCTHYTYSTCPSYCTPTCCTQTSTPTVVPPTATRPPTTTKAPATAANTGTQAPVPTKAPVSTWNGYNSYQPYQCNVCQSLYSNPICYALCDEHCCKQQDDVKSLVEKVVDLKQQLKKYEDLLHSGKTSDYAASVNGNAVPIFNSKAKLAVRNLRRNIAKLQAKINIARKKLGGQNIDDIVYEKLLKAAEKQTGAPNSGPNFEKELDELEKNVDDTDVSPNALPNKKEESKDDLENFDLDIEALDLAERSSDFKNTSVHSEEKKNEGSFKGPKQLNGAFVYHETEQNKESEYHHEEAAHNVPASHHDAHNYEGPEPHHETEAYREPEETTEPYHGTERHQGTDSYKETSRHQETETSNYQETEHHTWPAMSNTNTSTSYGFPEMNKTYEEHASTISSYKSTHASDNTRQKKTGAHFAFPEEQHLFEVEAPTTNTTYDHTYNSHTDNNPRQNNSGAQYVHPEEQHAKELETTSSLHTSSNAAYDKMYNPSHTNDNFRQNNSGAHYVHPEEQHVDEVETTSLNTTTNAVYDHTYDNARQNTSTARYVHPEEQYMNEETTSSSHTTTNGAYHHTYGNARQNTSTARYVHPEEQHMNEEETTPSSHTTTNATYDHTYSASGKSRQNEPGAQFVHPDQSLIQETDETSRLHTSTETSSDTHKETVEDIDSSDSTPTINATEVHESHEDQNELNLDSDETFTDIDSLTPSDHKETGSSHNSHGSSYIHTSDLPGSQHHKELDVDLKADAPKINTDSSETRNELNSDLEAEDPETNTDASEPENPNELNVDAPEPNNHNELDSDLEAEVPKVNKDLSETENHNELNGDSQTKIATEPSEPQDHNKLNVHLENPSPPAPMVESSPKNNKPKEGVLLWGLTNKTKAHDLKPTNVGTEPHPYDVHHGASATVKPHPFDVHIGTSNTAQHEETKPHPYDVHRGTSTAAQPHPYDVYHSTSNTPHKETKPHPYDVHHSKSTAAQPHPYDVYHSTSNTPHKETKPHPYDVHRGKSTTAQPHPYDVYHSTSNTPHKETKPHPYDIHHSKSTTVQHTDTKPHPYDVHLGTSANVQPHPYDIHHVASNTVQHTDTKLHPYDVHLGTSSTIQQTNTNNEENMEQQGHDTSTEHSGTANIGMVDLSSSNDKGTIDDIENSTLAADTIDNYSKEKTSNSINKSNETFEALLSKNTTNTFHANSSNNINLDSLLEKAPTNVTTTTTDDIDGSIVKKKDIDVDHLNPKFRMHKNIDNVHQPIAVKNGTHHASISGKGDFINSNSNSTNIRWE